MTDDRILCTACANLRGGECRAFGRRYHPVLELLRRCEHFAPLQRDADQRSGTQRWPELWRAYAEGRIA